MNDRTVDISFPGKNLSISGLSVLDLLPETRDYMTYEGSLTQPSCYETVTWIVFNKPIYVTKDDVSTRPISRCLHGRQRAVFCDPKTGVRWCKVWHHHTSLCIIHIKLRGHSVEFTVSALVAVSSSARIWGKCSIIDSSPGHFFF